MFAGWEGDSDNTLRGNTANDNARNGIYAFGATENTFEANKMFGNAILDARDDARDSPRQKRMERKPVRDRLSRRQHLRLRSAVRVR